MKRSEVIETLKWSLSKCRKRVPVRVFDILNDIENVKPGLAGEVIQKAKDQFSFLWQYNEEESMRKGGLVVLAGPVGIGKTVAATFLALMMVESKTYKLGERDLVNRKPPRFWFVPAQLIIDNAYDKKAVAQDMPVMRLKDCNDILIVDDLGREFVKKRGWSLSVVDEFFDARYRNKLPTIATTNMDEQEFKERYGDRVWDRFREWGKWIWTPGESLR